MEKMKKIDAFFSLSSIKMDWVSKPFDQIAALINNLVK